MKLQIGAGECATVEFPTRPHTTAALRILDEHGNQLLMIQVLSGQATVEVDVLPYLATFTGEQDGSDVLTFSAPQPRGEQK